MTTDSQYFVSSINKGDNMGMIFLFFLFDLDYTCDEKTLLTNLNHVCEIVVEKVPMVEVGIPTKFGMVFKYMECPRGTKLIGDRLCEKKNFVLKYEIVVEYEDPVRWMVATKFGTFRHEGWYMCRTGWKLNKENKCESSYQQRIKKK